MTKPLLYLHVGPCKTGTTSFQFIMHYLNGADSGVFYPNFSSQGRGRFGSENYKQHEIVLALINHDYAQIEDFIDYLTIQQKPILLSDESLWYKFSQIDPNIYSAFLTKLNEHFFTHVIFVNRPFDILIRSLHRQYLKNYEPNTDTPSMFTQRHGSLTFHEYLNHPNIKTLENYERFLRFFQTSGCAIDIFPYSSNVLIAMLDFLQIPEALYMPLLSQVKNISPSEEAHALYFALNKKGITRDEKELVRIFIESDFITENARISRLANSIDRNKLVSLQRKITNVEFANFPNLGFEINNERFNLLKIQLNRCFDEFIDFFKEIS